MEGPVDRFPENRNISWRLGIDWQGIPWDSPMMYSREELRHQRLNYTSFRSCETPLDFYRPPTAVRGEFFKFRYNYGTATCKYNHFQLRRNVQAYSVDKVLFLHAQGSVQSLNPITGELSVVKPAKQGIKIVGFDAADGLIVTAGYYGNFHVDTLDGRRVLWVDRLQGDAGTEFTNSCRFFKDAGELQVISCSNDKFIRVHHLEQAVETEAYQLGVCVNYAAASDNLIAAAIDAPEVPVIDRRTGQTQITCEGHADHSFGVEWHPTNAYQLATCNQDKSVRVWDIRTGRAVQVLCGKACACLDVQFSQDGKYLAFGEAIDFVHVYDTRSFEAGQIIDVFGNLSGISFNRFEAHPTALYIGLSDRTFSSLMEFHNQADDELTNLAI